MTQTYMDLRGAELAFDVHSVVGVNLSITVKDNGSARDLSSATVYAAVLDDMEKSGSYGANWDGYESRYTMTITDAPNGVFTLYIPPNEFTNKDAGRVTIVCWMEEASVETPICWGYANIQERG